MHRINADGTPSGLRAGIEAVRHEQKTGQLSYGYVFTGSYLMTGAGSWFAPAPPLVFIHYVVVPPAGAQPYFHYGMDSMEHIDAAEYVKWIKSLNLW